MPINLNAPVPEKCLLVSYIKAELARLFEGGDEAFFSQFNNLLGNFLCAPGREDEIRRLAKALIGPSYRNTKFESLFDTDLQGKRWYFEELGVKEYYLPDMEYSDFFKQKRNLKNLKDFTAYLTANKTIRNGYNIDWYLRSGPRIIPGFNDVLISKLEGGKVHIRDGGHRAIRLALEGGNALKTYLLAEQSKPEVL